MQLSDDRGRTKLYHGREPITDCSSWISFHGELHPETDPATIAAQHRDEVAAAVESLRASGNLITIAAVSEFTFMPAWNVKRALDSLGITPAPNPEDPNAPTYTDSQLLVLIRKLIGSGMVATSAIAAAAKLPLKTVRDFMLARPAAFKVHREHRKVLQWSLIENFGSGKNPARAGTASRAMRTPTSRATRTIEKLRAAAANRVKRAVV